MNDNMKLLEQTLLLKFSYSFSYPKEKVVFFDIETTGLFADTSSLYLIGCIFYDHTISSWKLIQWFSNNYQSESFLLDAFFSFLKNYQLLIHYNGTRFDIPYLLKKCEQFSLPYDFSQMEQLDLYKEIFPYKKYFGLSSLKQTTLEAFLGIKRMDTFTGKELISIYSDYIHQKYLTHQHSNSLYQQLCLHNQEDLLGMTQITLFLHYIEIINAIPETVLVDLHNNILILTIPLDCLNHIPIYKQKDSITVEWKEEKIQITIILYLGILKFYYPNYKDYYYLPNEDQAIHKSVAQFVDKKYRQKAKLSNCYIKKDSIFLPVFDPELSFPLFYKEYKDKTAYLEWNKTILKEETFLKEYASSLLKHII